MSGFDCYIRTKEDLIQAINEYGFVPFFINSISGFSIEEHIAPECWYNSLGDSMWPAWDWKGPVIKETGCAYGKFFDNKAVYISMEWFPDFANYRRSGYDFDARFDDGLAAYKDKELFELLDLSAPILSKELKEKGNYRKDGKKGFDTMMNRLQSQCYVIISDFVYQKDKHGKPYGWGIAEYSTPEKFMGSDFTDIVYERTPDESYWRILEHLKKLLPGADETAIRKILK